MIPTWLTRLNAPPQIPAAEVERLRMAEMDLTRDNERLRRELDSTREENVRLGEWLKTMIDNLNNDFPSIADQTHWPVGFFDFGKAKQPDIRYFNCGLIRREDGLWLVTRRSHNHPIIKVGMNDIVAFKLEGKLPVIGKRVAFPTTLARQHHEDPRVCKMGNGYFVSATTFQVSVKNDAWTGAHQVIGRVNDNWQVEYLADPMYGKNGGSPLMNRGNEKNWLWFEHDRKPHLVYLTKPHTIVQFTPDLLHQAEVEYVTDSFNPLWQHGEARGGTPPVLVGDEYFTFFHSSMPWYGQKRRYFMGALAFAAEPPFPITRMTSLPLLAGSKKDEWHDGLPLVVFPCGALFENDQWLVTLGVNDCCSAWIEIPHDDLLQLLRPIHESVPQETEVSFPPEPTEATGAAVEPVEAKQGGGEPSVALDQPASDEKYFRHAPKRVSRTRKPASDAGKRQRVRKGAGPPGRVAGGD